MNPLESLTLAWQALRHTVPQLWRPTLWLWALPLAAAQLLVVLLLWHAAHPAVSWFMAPLLVRLSGDDTLHYPRIFELLPVMYRRADLVIGATLGAIGIGAATPAFAAHFRGEQVAAGRALAEAFRRAPALVLVQLPFNVLLFLVGTGAGILIEGRSGLVTRLAPLAVAAVSLAIQAAFFYAAALVVLEKRSALSAWGALPSTWRPGLLSAFLVSAVTLVALLPLQAPGVSAALLVQKGRPELAGALTLLHAFAGWLNGFILTGAATLLYLSVVRSREEDR
jgi:hypothetical protein